jgi:hypothetical protein
MKKMSCSICMCSDGKRNGRRKIGGLHTLLKNSSLSFLYFATVNNFKLFSLQASYIANTVLNVRFPSSSR